MLCIPATEMPITVVLKKLYSFDDAFLFSYGIPLQAWKCSYVNCNFLEQCDGLAIITGGVLCISTDWTHVHCCVELLYTVSGKKAYSLLCTTL